MKPSRLWLDRYSSGIDEHSPQHFNILCLYFYSNYNKLYFVRTFSLFLDNRHVIYTYKSQPFDRAEIKFKLIGENVFWQCIII